MWLEEEKGRGACRNCRVLTPFPGLPRIMLSSSGGNSIASEALRILTLILIAGHTNDQSAGFLRVLAF